MTTYKKELQETVSYWRARMLKAQAEKLEIENALKRKELIHVSEVEKVLSEVSSILKSRLLSLPRAVSKKLEDLKAAQIEKVLDKEVRLLLNDAYTKIENFLSSLESGVDNDERSESETPESNQPQD